MRRILGPLVLALGTAQALGGTILTGASDIGSGAAPKQGVVEILPDAPPGPPPRIAPPVAPGSIGPLPPPIPPFSGGGSGADGAFFAASDETLVGGIREYTTYIVPAGVTVTYEGDVEVRASGPVAIAGTVLGTGGIAFRCEGSFDVTRASEAELFGGITASGDIDIDAVGTVRSSRFLESRRGSVEIVSHHVHATPTVDAGIRVDAGVWSARGVRLVSASSLLLGSHCDIRTADVALRAQNVTLDGAYIQSWSDLAIDTSEALTAAASRLTGRSARISVSAGGAIFDATRIFVARDLSLVADGSISLVNSYPNSSGASLSTSLSGKLRLESLRSTVDIVDGSFVSAIRGAVFIAGAEGVRMGNRSGVFSRSSKALAIHSASGPIELFDTVRIESEGDVEFRAATALTAGPNPDVYPPTIVGRSVSLACFRGPAMLNVNEVVARRGRLSVCAGTSLALRGLWVSRKAASFSAADGGVDASAADLLTSDGRRLKASAGILLESYSGDLPLILATGATIRSGQSRTRSGSVILRARQSNAESF